jgi:hypothetical protein
VVKKRIQRAIFLQPNTFMDKFSKNADLEHPYKPRLKNEKKDPA